MLEQVLDMKQKLVKVVHYLHEKGWAPATCSSYSFREPDSGFLWISAAVLDKGDFHAENFMQIDAQGKALREKQTPSPEARLHTLVYALFPEANCVLHSHSVLDTVLSRVHMEAGEIRFSGYDILTQLTGVSSHQEEVRIPIFANDARIPLLAHRIGLYLIENPDVPGYFLEGHGFYTWGPTILQARRQLEVVEFLLEARHVENAYRHFKD